jgi:hypothetical protein
MEETRAVRNVMPETSPMCASSPQGMRHAAFSTDGESRFLSAHKQESEWMFFFW